MTVRNTLGKIGLGFVFAVLIWAIVLMIVGLYNSSRYDKEKFNCVDFTSETIEFLRPLGIKSYQVVGMDKDNSSRGHSWVGIDINGYILHFEPQSWLFFIPEWEYTNIYVNKVAYYGYEYYRHHDEERGYYISTE